MLRVNGFILIGGREAKARAAQGLARLAHRSRGQPPWLSTLTSHATVGVYATDPSVTRRSRLILHGEFYEQSGTEEIVEPRLERGDPAQAGATLAGVDGSYALAAATDEALWAARDPIGLKPLYYGQNSDAYGLASEPQALQAAGFSATRAITPGTMVRLSPGGPEVRSFYKAPERSHPGSLPEVAAELEQLLTEAVRKRAERFHHLAIGFSGGLDSAVLAVLAARVTRATAITTAVPGSRDAQRPSELARQLGLDTQSVLITPVRARAAAEQLRRRLPHASVMDLSIAVAIALTSQAALAAGAERLILGQLADELFGGYAKYLRTLRTEGAAATGKMMRHDVLHAWQGNLERDENAAAPYLDLVLPYAALPVVEFGLNLPLQFKLDPAAGRRKIVLREVAQNLGLPADITEGPKRALQYSSGIQRVLEPLS